MVSLGPHALRVLQFALLTCQNHLR